VNAPWLVAVTCPQLTTCVCTHSRPCHEPITHSSYACTPSPYPATSHATTSHSLTPCLCPPPQVIDALLAHPQLGALLVAPAVSYGAANLYMRGVLEADTRHNLGRAISELVGEEDAAPVLTVNDKKLSAPLRVRLRMGRAMEG
jgi:hypothetical protein